MRRLIVLAAALAACQGDFGGPPICTGEFRYGILLEIRDFQTTNPLAFETLAVATDGVYADSAVGVIRDGLHLGLAGERPGTYDVTVTRGGYLPFERQDVVVESDVCHVQTVKIDVRLIPVGN